MKLIDIIKIAYGGMPMTLNAIYTLTSDILEKYQYELSQCDEFKNCQLIITKLPRVQVGINTYDVSTRRIWDEPDRITDTAPNYFTMNLNNGIFYLYQVNTTDFKSFDVRGYLYDLKSMMNISVHEGVQEINMEFDGKKVSEELSNLANKVADESNFDEVMKARTKSTFHEPSSIPDYVIDALKNINTEKIENDLSSASYRQNFSNPIFKEQEKDSYTDLVKEINTIEKTLNDCDGLDDDQIIALKDKIKNFESKLKDKVKPKTITISSSVHNKIKKYCQDLGLKIGDWVESSLLKAMNTFTNEEVSEDKIKDDIIKRYFESKKINKLLKADKLILMPKFKFKGYSHVDFKPVYDYLGNEKDFAKDMKNIRTNITVVADNREIYAPSYLPEFADTEIEIVENNFFTDEENPELLFEKIKNMFRIK